MVPERLGMAQSGIEVRAFLGRGSGYGLAIADHDAGRQKLPSSLGIHYWLFGLLDLLK